MTTREWDECVRAWSHVPIDDVGYLSSSNLLSYPIDDLMGVVERMRVTRYSGWRNHRGLWRDVLGLDSLSDKDILDFGCGSGVEALELALGRNRVQLADISTDNLLLATRVLQLYSDSLSHMHGVLVHVVRDQWPFLDCSPATFDVFYCSGVLHHIHWPRQIMERAHELLRPDGEVRLMVYSDEGWRLATGTDPPEQVVSHPLFERFVRHFDAVGSYADWYNKDRLVAWFGDLFSVERCEYLTPNRQYLAAVLRRK